MAAAAEDDADVTSWKFFTLHPLQNVLSVVAHSLAVIPSLEDDFAHLDRQLVSFPPLFHCICHHFHFNCQSEGNYLCGSPHTVHLEG